jgi:hypothetical protein
MGSGLPFSFESRTIWLDWAGLRGMLYDRAAGFRFFSLHNNKQQLVVGWIT